MIESIGYSNCTSCKKALAHLHQSGVTFEHRDYFKDRFTVEELGGMLGRARLSPQEVLSKKSKVYRADPDRYDNLGDDALLQEMIEQPTLLRRPIMFDQSGAVVGFNEKRLNELIDRAG